MFVGYLQLLTVTFYSKTEIRYSVSIAIRMWKVLQFLSVRLHMDQPTSLHVDQPTFSGWFFTYERQIFESISLPSFELKRNTLWKSWNWLSLKLILFCSQDRLWKGYIARHKFEKDYIFLSFFRNLKLILSIRIMFIVQCSYYNLMNNWLVP